MDDDSSTVLTTALGSQSVTLELEATGYAQVLVILTESSAPQPAALAWPQSGRKGRSSENALAAAPDLLSLERYFTVAAEARTLRSQVREFILLCKMSVSAFALRRTLNPKASLRTLRRLLR